MQPDRPIAHELGDEIRALIDTAVDRDAADLRAAIDHVRAARELLAGPTRRRFYEGFSAGGDITAEELAAGWSQFLEFAPFGGRANPLGPPVELEWTQVEGHPALAARVTFGSAYEGAPHCVHGGFVAALIDDVFGMAQHHYGVTAATAALDVRFVAPTPVRKELTFHAWYDDVRSRRLHGHATCHAGDTLTARADGLFVVVDMAQMGERSRAT
jgi:acyl-coenzyme A thioesterase PaaI-like protein